MRKHTEHIISRAEVEEWMAENYPDSYYDTYRDCQQLRMPEFKALLATQMECLTNLGFKYVKSRMSYEIVEDDRIFTIYFNAFSKYTVGVCLRTIIQFKSIHKLLKTILKKYNLLNDVGDVFTCLDYRMPINPKDGSEYIDLDYAEAFVKLVDAVKAMLPRICELKANLHSVKDLDRLYNDPPFCAVPGRVIYNNYPCGCMIGLIAAKLANNPNYDHLVQVYRDFFDSLVQKFKRDGDDEATIRSWKACNTDIFEAIIDYFAKK